MKILTLKLKNKNNTNIFVASTEKGQFDLHSEIIVKNNIKAGQIDVDVFFKAVLESNILIATERAMKYISTKLKTQHQIKDYLYKQGYNSSVVNPVLAKLNEYHLVDDLQFAKSYISSNKNFSNNKLKQKLIGFGVKTDILDELLADLDDAPTCQKAVQKFLKNKQKDEKTIQKLIRHLQSKGFSYETIKSVLNELKLNDFEN